MGVLAYENGAVPEGIRPNFALHPALARWAKLSRPGYGAGLEAGWTLSPYYSFRSRVLAWTL
jgi:hypothetical protein